MVGTLWSLDNLSLISYDKNSEKQAILDFLNNHLKAKPSKLYSPKQTMDDFLYFDQTYTGFVLMCLRTGSPYTVKPDHYPTKETCANTGYLDLYNKYFQEYLEIPPFDGLNGFHGALIDYQKQVLDKATRLVKMEKVMKRHKIHFVIKEPLTTYTN